MTSSQNNTFESAKNRTLRTELEARINDLETTLLINGYLVKREHDQLLIKTRSGYAKTAYFNKERLEKAFHEAGIKAVSNQKVKHSSSSAPTQEELQKAYLAAGEAAIDKTRSQFVQNYLSSILQDQRKKEREQVLNQASKTTPQKEQSSPEL